MPDPVKKTCGVCGNVGKNGAQFVLKAKGKPDTPVHAPCGERAVAAAPKDAEAKVVKSAELRKQNRSHAHDRVARDFWKKPQQHAPQTATSAVKLGDKFPKLATMNGEHAAVAAE